jgi:DNA-binding response OmpR family regulator
MALGTPAPEIDVDSKASQKQQKRRILVVEDEALLGWSLVSSLERAGYVVHLVESGESAIAKLGVASYDLVVTDVKLPHIDGFEVATVAKTLARPIPVIVISAIDDPCTRALLAKTHVERFLEKPFDFGELSTTIAELLLPR